MKPDYDVAKLDELIALLLDGALPPEGEAEIGRMLGNSRQARDHYRASLRVHAALIRHSGDVPQRMAGAEKVSRMRWMPFVGMAAAACLALGLWLAVRTSAAKPVAWISGSKDAVWAEGGGLLAGSDDVFKRPLHLARGFAEVSFKSGVKVVLEGPCRFEITAPGAMTFSHGRASVKAPEVKPAGFEFHLDTPGGRLTDLGTEFGVSVGSGSDGPVVLAEVFDGAIEVPGDGNARKQMHAGDAGAIVHDAGGTQYVTTLNDYPVDPGNLARRLPATTSRPDFSGNLALGKPVTTPAYLSKARGSVFPPENLTDGRLNDTGSPGDWSFWLAPDGQTGEFTVDLGQPEWINRVAMQNTRNRKNGDRGMRGFVLMVSEDGTSFREVLREELRRVERIPPPGTDFPFESFSFPKVHARYVKLVGVSHYHEENRMPGDKHYDYHSGGLNEIQVFGP